MEVLLRISTYYCCTDLVLGRQDGAASPLVSEAILHLVDTSRSMLLFATRTYMLDALTGKNKGVKIAISARLAV